jgi:Histidine kinase-, DNA gyrase B-, and HSP90-like ATPase
VPDEGSAQTAVDRLVARFAAALRGGSVLAGGIVAFVGLAPPASRTAVTVAVGVLAIAAARYAAAALTTGLSPSVVAVDVLLAVALCLAHDRLVPAEALMDGSSWVLVVASTTVIISQLQPRPLLGVAATALVVAAHAAGLLLSGRSDITFELTAVLVVQGVLTGGFMAVLRRSARSADAALHAHDIAEREATVRAARRADEQAQYRLLHDSVSATLTVVATGGSPAGSPTLRGQAARDLQVLEQLQSPVDQWDGEAGLSRLDRWLSPVVERAGPALRVDCVVTDVEVPRAVGVALAAATAEALANVRRHAGVSAVRLRAAAQDGGVLVEIEDAGRGFDPARVSPHRRGLRESLCGRMRSVGGSARIVSQPGEGTRVELRWPDG